MGKIRKLEREKPVGGAVHDGWTMLKCILKT
jgi:hypothetical protein